MSKVISIIHYLFVVTGLLLSAIACKKNTGRSGDGDQSPAKNVYILGTVGDSVVVWKNGIPNSLYSQSKVVYALGSASLFASDNDVYVAGFRLNNITGYSTSPLYWRNETATDLPDISRDAAAKAIFISNNDVYVAGIANYLTDTFHVPYTTPTANYPPLGNRATVWKNGVASTLPGYHSVGLTGGGQYAVSTYSDYVSGMFVSGNDVYVSGGSRLWGNNAGYWKNGVLVDLSKATTYTAMNGFMCYPTTTSIAVSGNDVYVAGYQLTSTRRVTAMYWKNGVPAYLTTDSISGSAANAVFVSRNDVYIAGYQNINGYSRAICWKNGVPITLNGSIPAIANAVFVAGNDVYVAGYQWKGFNPYIANFWKNGVAVNLTDGTTSAIANAIFVE